VESRLAAADLQKAADTLVIALACAGDDSAFAEVVRRGCWARWLSRR
jgi:hypothetical protein